MYLTTTTTITAPSLCRINIKNNVLDITVPYKMVLIKWSFLKNACRRVPNLREH